MPRWDISPRDELASPVRARKPLDSVSNGLGLGQRVHHQVVHDPVGTNERHTDPAAAGRLQDDVGRTTVARQELGHELRGSRGHGRCSGDRGGLDLLRRGLLCRRRSGGLLLLRCRSLGRRSGLCRLVVLRPGHRGGTGCRSTCSSCGATELESAGTTATGCLGSPAAELESTGLLGSGLVLRARLLGLRSIFRGLGRSTGVQFCGLASGGLGGGPAEGESATLAARGLGSPAAELESTGLLSCRLVLRASLLSWRGLVSFRLVGRSLGCGGATETTRLAAGSLGRRPTQGESAALAAGRLCGRAAESERTGLGTAGGRRVGRLLCRAVRACLLCGSCVGGRRICTISGLVGRSRAVAGV